MKFVVGENGRNPEKNLPRPRFFHHETHMEGPRREFGTPAVGGERLTACATRPNNLYTIIIYTILLFTDLTGVSLKAGSVQHIIYLIFKIYINYLFILG